MNFLREHVFAPLFIFLLFVTLFFMIAFVRFIIITAKIRRWRKFAVPAVGVVGKLKDVNCIYDRYGEIFSYRHNFELKIICGAREFESVYSEEVLPDHIPITRPGQKINILWSERDYKYFPNAKTRSEKRQLIKQILNDTSSRFLRAHPEEH